jgi:hypothetical protein
MLTLEERFWAKVDRGDPDECWTWLAYRRPDGYGSLRMGTLGVDRRNERAHRLSWTLANGPIPAGLLVLHRCDNPSCVNPAHLFLGTDQDNADDRQSKGRGVRNGNQDKTHCAHGHLLAGANVYHRPRGGRSCRACHQVAVRRYRAAARQRSVAAP